MYAALSVRKLKPGAFGDWRQAWEPDEWPETVKKAYILRNLADPDEVIAFGLSEATLDELTALRDDSQFAESERVRHERMALHVESESVSGFYEVVEVLHPTAVAR
jgi:hypothetical protein